ncbi:alpha/beta fold hydrolase [Desulfuromonas sp. TF]|uniref:alpha/beta fold hydrolase n=1 Tax=Desulfuromonas sp. TF TaxID=1232410 RepID=UPI0003FE0BF4|nr:alpha/beta hydrolase [Desulfuromonas sp. TF]
MKATVNGITLGYDDIGSGPAVVLLHDFPLSRRMWDPQIAPLVTAGYRVIVPDLRGFGESSKAEASCEISEYADDVVALLDYLGIGRAVFGGMSMGGYVLFNLLERFRSRAMAAAFFATRSGADTMVEKARGAELAEKVVKGDRPQVIDHLAGLLFAEGTMKTQPALFENVKRWMDSTDSHALTAGLLAMRNRMDYATPARYLDRPALVVGAERDRSVKPEHSRFLAAALPCCTSCIIPGAGHLVNMERPEEFNRCLLDFLGSLAVYRHADWRKVA